MRVDGQILEMDATEEPCTRNCVSPGRTGVRVVHFWNARARATLRVPSACHKDSEVCAGLLAAQGSLVVYTETGRARHTVWNEDCDQ